MTATEKSDSFMKSVALTGKVNDELAAALDPECTLDAILLLYYSNRIDEATR
jgi:hypothetical protein